MLLDPGVITWPGYHRVSVSQGVLQEGGCSKRDRVRVAPSDTPVHGDVLYFTCVCLSGFMD